MNKRTVRATYEKIRKGHLLSPARMRVYADLYAHGPSTAGAVTKRLSTARTANPSFHRRLSELVRLGVVARRAGTRCAITGHKADVWYITGSMPVSQGVARAPKGLLKESLYLGIEELFILIDHERRANPDYAPSRALMDMSTWLMRRAKAVAARDLSRR